MLFETSLVENFYRCSKPNSRHSLVSFLSRRGQSLLSTPEILLSQRISGVVRPELPNDPRLSLIVDTDDDVNSNKRTYKTEDYECSLDVSTMPSKVRVSTPFPLNLFKPLNTFQCLHHSVHRPQTYRLGRGNGLSLPSNPPHFPRSIHRERLGN